MVGSIDLSADSQWVIFLIGGVEFQCEVFETVDRLVDVDRKHAEDLNLCLACRKEFVFPQGVDPADFRCSHCGSSEFRASQLYLDSVVELIRSLASDPKLRCGRREAAKFYSTIVELSRNLKKNTG